MNQAFAMGASEESVVAPVLRTRSGSSPSHSSYYQESAFATPRSRFSHEYGDSQLGSFNPNAIFSPIQHRVAGLDLNQSYEASPALRRGSSSSDTTGVGYQTQSALLSFGPGAPNMVNGTPPDFPTSDQVWGFRMLCSTYVDKQC